MGKVLPPHTGGAIKVGKHLRGLSSVFTKNPTSKALFVAALILFGVALTTLDR